MSPPQAAAAPAATTGPAAPAPHHREAWRAPGAPPSGGPWIPDDGATGTAEATSAAGTAGVAGAVGTAGAAEAASAAGAWSAWRRRRLPRVGPTSRGWGLVALSVLLAVAWYLLRLHLLMDAALLILAPVATALLVAVGLVAVNLLRCPRPRVEVLGLPQVGHKVQVVIRADCLVPGFLPAWVVWRVRAGRAGLARTPVGAGRSLLAVGAELRGPAGLEAVGLEVIEPLGLARARLPLGSGLTMLILPRPLPLPGPPAHPRASLRPGGRAGEQGQERVGSLRDYRPGDALASIHWKQSARLDRLVVTEQEHEALPQARLALVADDDAYPRTDHAETAVAMAAGVIEAWGRERHGIDLLLLARAPAGARRPGAPRPGSARIPGSARPPGGSHRPGDIPAASGSPGAQDGDRAWMVLRYRCEEALAPALVRVLALLEPNDPDCLEAVRRRAAHHEPGLMAEISPLPARLSADVVITGPGSPRGRWPSPSRVAGPTETGPTVADPAAAGPTAVEPGARGGPTAAGEAERHESHPPLDPSARGTLVVVGGNGGPLQGGSPRGPAPGDSGSGGTGGSGGSGGTGGNGGAVGAASTGAAPGGALERTGPAPATWRVLEAPARSWGRGW